ncbi:hypothetical protein ACA910_000080 [Epithemia clementina (nom. ined.)]
MGGPGTQALGDFEHWHHRRTDDADDGTLLLSSKQPLSLSEPSSSSNNNNNNININNPDNNPNNDRTTRTTTTTTTRETFIVQLKDPPLVIALPLTLEDDDDEDEQKQEEEEEDIDNYEGITNHHHHRLQQTTRRRKKRRRRTTRHEQRRRQLLQEQRQLLRRQLEQQHVDLLAQYAPDATLVHSYTYTVNGFAARLTSQQAQVLASLPQVTAVDPDVIVTTKTTSQKTTRQTNQNNQPQQQQQQHDSHTHHRRATEYTPDYLGLTQPGQLWSQGHVGEDVVIAIIDTGIYPEHPSFADVPTPLWGNSGPAMAYGPPPPHFVGTGCALNDQDSPLSSSSSWNCTNKILAAKCYVTGFSSVVDPTLPCGGNGNGLDPTYSLLSARDEDGHGSHVASIAAGNYGVEAVITTTVHPTTEVVVVGTLSGMAPRARLSIYKVCWIDSVTSQRAQCSNADIAKAIDDAVADGVHVINASMLLSYGIGITGLALLNALRAGVVASAVGGNQDSLVSSTGGGDNQVQQQVDQVNAAWHPWSALVGAILDDRTYAPHLAIAQPASLQGLYGAVPAECQACDANHVQAIFERALVPARPLTACQPVAGNSRLQTRLRQRYLRGRIALVQSGGCDFTDKFNHVAAAGAVAILVYRDPNDDDDDPTPYIMVAPNTTIPGFMIDYETGHRLYQAYHDLERNTSDASSTMSLSSSPESILVSFRLQGGEFVAPFSSHGPNQVFPNLIAPDVVAPGGDIWAAATPYTGGPYNLGGGQGQLFARLSGTSMASPHVAGVLALLKQAHPDWSPSALVSSLMTTARREGIYQAWGGGLATPFDIGSGLIQPNAALDPGVVFNITYEEYLAFVCGTSLPSISLIPCDELASQGYSFDLGDFNYPSIALSTLEGSKTFVRTVTNVAADTAERPLVFTAQVSAPLVLDGGGVTIVVNPTELVLAYGESATFEVTIQSTAQAKFNEWVFGSITWTGQQVPLPPSSSRRTTQVQTSTSKMNITTGQLRSPKKQTTKPTAETRKERRTRQLMARPITTKPAETEADDLAEKTYTVYLPIAVKPIALQVPSIASSHVSDGGLSYQVSPFYNGNLKTTVHGPAEASMIPGTVPQGESVFLGGIFPAGMLYARVALYDAFTANGQEEGKDDLNLRLYIQETPTSEYEEYAASTGPTSNEMVEYYSTTNVEEGGGGGVPHDLAVLVRIDGVTLESGNSTTFTLFLWRLYMNDDPGWMEMDDGSPGRSVQAFVPQAINITWTGLESSSAPYFGAVTYTTDDVDGSLGMTLVEIVP